MMYVIILCFIEQERLGLNELVKTFPTNSTIQ